jgi:hypothetical protein
MAGRTKFGFLAWQLVALAKRGYEAMAPLIPQELSVGTRLVSGGVMLDIDQPGVVASLSERTQLEGAAAGFPHDIAARWR